MTEIPRSDALRAPTPHQASRSPRLGRTAMLVAIALIVLSVTSSAVIGIFATTVFRYPAGGFTVSPDQVPFALQTALGSLLGVWALVQGIVATVQNRGRRYGIVAIVLTGAAPLVSLIVWGALGYTFGHTVRF